MLLIITRNKPNNVNQLAQIYDTFNTRKIPYEIVAKCDPAIIRRKDVCGLIIPGARFRIHPEEKQDELELELYYLFHFPKLPVLGICHGCQLLMVYYGGYLVPYTSFWIKNPDIELDISRGDRIFHGEEPLQKLHVHFHDLPVMTPAAKKAGVREIAWFREFRDGRRHACAFEFVKDRVYGFMFHPEAKKETRGILYNFYDNIAASVASASSSASSASSAS
jgi:GMP synthase-like glutamine amidotransferase